MKFPNAEMLLKLYELEQQFLKLGRGVLEEEKFQQKSDFKCREMGRAAGFFAAAHIMTEQISRIGR